MFTHITCRIVTHVSDHVAPRDHMLRERFLFCGHMFFAGLVEILISIEAVGLIEAWFVSEWGWGAEWVGLVCERGEGGAQRP